MAIHQSHPDVSATGTRHVHGVCPLDCPDTCSWVVTVEDGRAVKLLGNREHPYTRGALCEKVNRYLEHTRQADRLLWPMRRTGNKGEGRFARISWDEALGEIASRWRAIIERDGPQAIWPYYGTGTLGMIQGLAGAGRRLWNVLGTTQHHLSICMSAGGFATGYTLGDNRMGMDPEGIADARLVILWGANPLVTHHHIWKFVEAARKKGGHVVVIDPVRTRSADQADEHLAVKPGTDAALALGLLHIVVAAAPRTASSSRRTRSAGRPSASASRRILLPASPRSRDCPSSASRRSARSWPRPGPRPSGSAPGCSGMPAGGMAVRTVTCIPGVTGDWRYPGGGAAYDTRGFFKGNWSALWRDDLRPPGTRVLAMTRLGGGAARRRPINRCRRSWSTAAIRRRARRTRAGSDKASRARISSPWSSTTSRPTRPTSPISCSRRRCRSSTPTCTIAYGHAYLAWNAPAVAAPGECLSNSEIFRRLARVLGVTEPCVYDSDEDLARAVLDGDELRLAGSRSRRWPSAGGCDSASPSPGRRSPRASPRRRGGSSSTPSARRRPGSIPCLRIRRPTRR